MQISSVVSGFGSPDHGHAPGQVEMITPRDRHGRLLATLQFGEGVGQTQLHAE